MQPRIHLNIPEPCHENWHNMTPSQQGRYCNACAKEVVDFTNMNDTEVLHYFLDRKNEKVCGRMYPDQLNRPVAKTVYPQKKKFWYWNYAAFFLLIFQKAAASKIHGGLKVEHAAVKNEPAFSVKDLYHFSKNKMLDTVKTVAGKIIDTDGGSVAFANVKIKGSIIAVAADANGQYKIKANTGTAVLQISAAGYEAAELELKTAKGGDVVLEKSKATLEGDIVITVGGISSDYDYTPASSTKHVAVIEVLDNATNLPVKATIALTNNDKTDTVTTDSKGIYKLKRIKEYDTYKLMVKADGYLETAIEIKGFAFNDRKETKYVFLEKIPVATDYKKMDEVMVTDYGNTHVCRYVTGAVSYVKADTVLSFKKAIQDTFNFFGTKKNAITIAPNPVVKGGAVAVSYAVKQSGNYFIQITNAAGQLIQQQQVFAAGKNNTTVVYTNAAWSSGLYYLCIRGAKNNLLSTNSFIVQ